MVRVPGIREYAPITDGVKWTEDLSKSTMIDFINNTEPSLNKRLIDWIQKNHEGFTGYDDAEFDKINKAAYLEVLKENIESDVFKPLLDKTIYSGKGEEELDILMQVKEGEKQFTLNDIVEGTAQNYALDVEDTESNKALFGELLINDAMELSPSGKKAVLVFNRLQDIEGRTSLGDTDPESLELINAWIQQKAVTDGIKESLINTLKMFKEGVVPYIYNPKEANTSLEDYLRSFQKGQLLLPENRKRSDRGMSVEEYLQAIYDMEPKERISLLNYNSKQFVDNLLNKLVTKGIWVKQKGVPKQLQGISIDESNLLGEVYKEIETLFNLNTVTPPSEMVTPLEDDGTRKLGKRDLSLTIDEMVDYFLENHEKEIVGFKKFLESDNQTDYSFNIYDWNPAKIRGVKHYSETLGQTPGVKKTFSGKKQIKDSTSDKKIGDLDKITIEIDKKENQLDLVKRIKEAFAGTGLLNEIVDMLYEYTRITKGGKAQSREEMTSGYEDNINYSQLYETEMMELILDGDKEMFLEYVENTITPIINEILNKNQNALGFEELPENFIDNASVLESELTDFIKNVKKYTTDVEDINELKSSAVNFLVRQGEGEVSTKLGELDFNTLSADEWDDWLQTNYPQEGGNKISNFKPALLQEYFKKDEISMSKEDKEKLVKLILWPLIGADLFIDVNNNKDDTQGTALQNSEKQVENSVAMIQYKGNLNLEYKFDKKGLTAEYDFKASHGIRISLGTKSTNFSVKRGASTLGSTNKTVSGKTISGFQSTFNVGKNKLKTEILKKLLKLKISVGDE